MGSKGSSGKSIDISNRNNFKESGIYLKPDKIEDAIIESSANYSMTNRYQTQKLIPFSSNRRSQGRNEKDPIIG